MTGSHTQSDLPILVVEDDAAILELLEEELQETGYQTLGVGSAEEAMLTLSHSEVAMIISDVRLPGMSGMQLLEQLRQEGSRVGFIVITAFGTIDQAVEALKIGADDFLTKPLDLESVGEAVYRVLENRRLAERFQQGEAPGHFHGIVGESETMQALFHDAARLAKSDAPILILGESGTGKELLARAIHAESPRAAEPFIAINCASIPSELMESEFFGHVKGAFTGASDSRQGLFQAANGGSLFLDEIGEMSPGLQAKLLRALQEKMVKAVGAEKEEAVDVRIIAATHRDLEQEIESGNFRSDLFYRLETFSLRIPPLRERQGDIERLVSALIEKHATAQGKRIDSVEPVALQTLLDYPYPGNVRELENAIMRAVTLAEDGLLSHADLPERIRQHGQEQRGVVRQIEAGNALVARSQQSWPSLEEVEKRYIQKVLEATGGNKRRTADILGIARRTLYRRLEED
ncbi:sigma-54-dependent transcriptional regulator [Billgrantia desiderata]|uniref:Sigma-54-dependent Fis family transcriptional regulator n=1 Tax=Billgrantia desiderata TaxID=52021 RepID=A0AAW4YQ27_9GAMM|nr:sigma-54 dependent transcriptional regulator [Halomonas desiderata]MCE8012970.1 sigma-54-dependent Fis family transcriptional regulator [Halomonas desiderata]MCE8028487.1 sigma-54-dependent Fis family transcriptional regulator [Halomonas desiderata]MCE8044646.1 sigma-54-dependent Fis family transcriptional regulator [Halomonas desiderata]MCE8049220.1 sigma-54-dependent Fis family transcriptional regulator [Halomonas desiderata]MCE8050101.1 sigma-54-dependent Fis family transcriptional regul